MSSNQTPLLIAAFFEALIAVLREYVVTDSIIMHSCSFSPVYLVLYP